MTMLFEKYNDEEYPQLGLAIGVYSRPGLVLVENSVLDALRYTMFASFAMSPVLIQLMKYKLPFADRPAFQSVAFFFKFNTCAFWTGTGVGIARAVYEARNKYSFQLDDDGIIDMVDDVVALRKDDTNFRYSYEAMRAMFVSPCVLLLFGLQGTVFQKISVGAGMGVVLATFACLTKMDKVASLVG